MFYIALKIASNATALCGVVRAENYLLKCQYISMRLRSVM
jgi:hypothetical protein